ncbi:MAG: beta-glycosidase [Prevotella sp.]|nr:beta-glycosidase [Prevotella sp.]
MKRISYLMLAALFCLAVNAKNKPYRLRMNLAGTWQFALDRDSSLTATTPMTDTVTLPGTTDTNRKGDPCTNRSETTHLSRLYSYVGKAWYCRDVEIPKTWRKKQICLHLERTKPSVVYVDGKRIGASSDITTPQVFDLTSALTPGRHRIAIRIDNGSGIPQQIYANSHAYTEDTQTNWNGIIGQLYLEAVNPVHLTSLTLTPSAARREVKVTVGYVGATAPKALLRLRVTDLKTGQEIRNQVARIIDKRDEMGEKRIDAVISLGDEARLWSEFHPDLYRLQAEIEGQDTLAQDFGLIDFEARGTQFFVNGHLTFLRGKHDACVFPETAHVPMDVESWLRYLGTCKAYGLNHVRFHSWCPPEAAFYAADRLGIYLQPELPFWGKFDNNDRRLMDFLHKEGLHLLRAYANHPSFVMMALGNELSGSVEAMAAFVKDFRAADSRPLYTFGSNYYLGYQGWKPGMDYFTTCRVGGEKYGEYHTHTRGSFSFADVADGGYLNHLYPNTVQDFEQAIAKCPVPVISHETAQFQTYPDFNAEIPQYKGVLRPYNMEIFRQRLADAGMGDQMHDFHMASGRWSSALYKADIEMDLRTQGFGGFQLLDLQDYPGQGSAYVGILDANMQTKGIITDKEWLSFCAPVVPLLRTDRFCYRNDETFRGRVQIAAYTEEPLRETTLQWTLSRLPANGAHHAKTLTVRCGQLAVPNTTTGLITVGDLQIPLGEVMTAGQTAGAYRLTLTVGSHKNGYDLWIYPQTTAPKPPKGLIVTAKLTDEIGKKLQSGARVLLMPDSAEYAGNTVGGLFTTDYWNWRMFKTISERNNKPVSPGTLGILTRPEHPLFSAFPTESHTNWQWFPIVKASRPMILDRLPAGYRPIVQVIDNIERNHRLGLIFELKVGEGRLLVCMSDLRQQERYPESQALYRSILSYMDSADFNPQTPLTLEQLREAFADAAETTKIKRLDNISY